MGVELTEVRGKEMRLGVSWRVIALVLALAVLGFACTPDEDEGDGNGDENGAAQQEQQSVFDAVVERGTLRCGVNETVPGFGFDPGTGEIEGFDIDFCRAIAAAVLGDPEAIELTPIDADNRFNALRADQYDVLVRNTTWTSSRDGAEGVAFAHPNFYDGQAMMVRTGEFDSIADMDGANICVTSGTTTELNLADYFQANNLDFEAVTFPENPQLQEAFIQERCDGWTSDRSQLAAIRSEFPQDAGGPEGVEILEEVMSKEPLAPAVLDGDQKWLDAVNWVVFGTILAEELGVDSGNVDQQASDPENPQVAALLGVPFGDEGEPVDSGLPLENDFMQAVLSSVGNYGEIFDRHLGPDTPLELERGINALWTEGGIQYAMPMR